MSTLRRALLALAATMLGGGLLPAAPASADDPWDIPDHATITLAGDGFGHGIGMSQYGAYGGAKRDMNYRQILDFYYPGTDLGDAGGAVRVLISADNGKLVVDNRRGLTVRNLHSGRSLRLPARKASQWKVVEDGARSRISYHSHGWHTWRSTRGDVELSAGGKPVALRLPGGSISYRGALRSTTHEGRRVTVNVLPMEAYVRGVVAKEMFSYWPQEALRVQAVASRSYAAYERAHRRSADWDLCDTAACQQYGGASAETSSSDRAVKTTAHRAVTYAGEPAFTQFSASDGGWTVADDRFPYLPAQQDPYEVQSKDVYGWTVELTSEEIEAAYNLENLTYLGIETRDGDGTGHVATVRIKTENGFDDTVTGTSFFNHFDLRSTMFRISSVDTRS